MLYYTKLNVHNTNRKIYRAREYYDNNYNSNSNDAIKASRKLDKRTEYLEHARSIVWEEATLSTYSTFTDYNQLIIQLGFVLLFAQVFPLAPLIALTNNLIQIRLDAYKICYTRQRPIAQKTSGVGILSLSLASSLPSLF